MFHDSITLGRREDSFVTLLLDIASGEAGAGRGNDG
jgi:hypothetical protein